MHKVKISLNTQSDIKQFVKLAQSIPEEVCLIDNANHCVNAKSIIGCLYSIEFDETFVVSDNPMISTTFREFLG